MKKHVEGTSIYFLLGLISFIGLGCRPDNDPSPNGDTNPLCQISSIKDSATNSIDSMIYDGQGRVIKEIDSRGLESIFEYYSNPSRLKVTYINSRGATKTETYMLSLGRIIGYIRAEPDSDVINGVVKPGIAYDTATFSYNGNGQITYSRAARKNVYEDPGLIARISISTHNFEYQDGRIVELRDNHRENDGYNGSFEESTTTTKYVYDLTRPMVKANPVVLFSVYNFFGTATSNQIPTLSVKNHQKIGSYQDPLLLDSIRYEAEINSKGYPIKITEYSGSPYTRKSVKLYRWKCN